MDSVVLMGDFCEKGHFIVLVYWTNGGLRLNEEGDGKLLYCDKRKVGVAVGVLRVW